MFALLDSYIEPQDGNDISPAWDRAMADGAFLIIATPGKTYTASRPLEVTRRVVFLAWLSLFYCTLGGLVLRPDARRSVIVGLDVNGTDRDKREHGMAFFGRAYLLFCVARKFGGDGFHVAADVKAIGTNANGGLALFCESTGHRGRGYAWEGGDANTWLALGSSSSGCTGEWYKTVNGLEVLQPGRVAGFHDASFLGTRIVACHSGVHTLTPNVETVGYAFEGDSGSGVMAFSYQEGDLESRVRHHNMAIGNLGQFTVDSDGFILGGRRIRGRIEYSRGDAIDATLTLGAPTAGAIGEIKGKLDAYGYALVRESAAASSWWSIRRGNLAAQTVLAFKTDAPQVLAPLGLMLGAQKRTINAAASKPSAAGQVGDMVLCSAPTATLDGWRYVSDQQGARWRPFKFPEGA